MDVRRLAMRPASGLKRLVLGFVRKCECGTSNACVFSGPTLLMRISKTESRRLGSISCCWTTLASCVVDTNPSLARRRILFCGRRIGGVDGNDTPFAFGLDGGRRPFAISCLFGGVPGRSFGGDVLTKSLGGVGGMLDGGRRPFAKSCLFGGVPGRSFGCDVLTKSLGGVGGIAS
jgi:hypothetical protein